MIKKIAFIHNGNERHFMDWMVVFLTLIFLNGLMPAINAAQTNSNRTKKKNAKKVKKKKKRTVYPETIAGIDWKVKNDEENPVAMDDSWNETAVRKVIYTFAYGGPATDKQIKKWASMKPDYAIKEILTFKTINTKLSHAKSGKKTGKAAMNPYFHDYKNRSLKRLAEFFISGRGSVRVDTRGKGLDAWGLPARVWHWATMIRGLNPFQQKIGIFETNYHMAVNLNTEVTERQIFRYYDDIMRLHAQGKTYDRIMAKAAVSAAAATQYRHRENIYKNSQFFGNEDFGREFHQLYFKILGKYALKKSGKYKPAIPDAPISHSNNDYHEYTTIRNTARALSGISVPAMKWPRDVQKTDRVVYGDKFNGGWPEDKIEILGYKIKGKNAKEKIYHLSKRAIRFKESERNLPVYIVRVLADDNLVEDGKESQEVKEKLKLIRALWKSFRKKKKYRLLTFLRMYAISKAFHHPSRYKYLTSLDRYVLVAKMSAFSDKNLQFYQYDYRLRNEGINIFRPTHDVFGGQTGIEASNTADVFRNAYNTSVKDYWWAGKAYEGNWHQPKWVKDYAKIIPYSYKEKGRKIWKVVDVAKWLWIRYIGSDKNFGFLEKMQVYALISSGRDFALFIAGDSWNNPPSKSALNIRYNEKYVMNNPAVKIKWQDLQKGLLFLDTKDPKKRREMANNIGLGINFIIATPYMFVQEGRN